MIEFEVFVLDISAIKTPINFGGSAQVAQTIQHTSGIISERTSKTSDVQEKSLTAPAYEKVEKKPIEAQDLTQMTEAMNKFVQAMDANISFMVHEKSNQLMVQVIDRASDRVLKEFPSSEFLDTIAAIRDYVGILLDKKI